VTLIELLALLAIIGLGIMCGRALYPYGILFAIFGFVGGAAIIPTIIVAHVRYRRWAYCGDKLMPECLCGGSAFAYRKVGTEYHLLCKECETRYEKCRSVVWVFENGQETIQTIGQA
jgi:hypothetical protein